VNNAVLEKLKAKAAELKHEISALHLAARDPRTPWHAKLLIVCLIAYALSPIDLIPDPIPIIGYLDDLVLLPLGIWLALRLLPPQVLQDCREQARRINQPLQRNWRAAVIIVLLWLIALIGIAYCLFGGKLTDGTWDARFGY
jgi:uncharacterized membrane protein YkvA (DUF1232 family)